MRLKKRGEGERKRERERQRERERERESLRETACFKYLLYPLIASDYRYTYIDGLLGRVSAYTLQHVIFWYKMVVVHALITTV